MKPGVQSKIDVEIDGVHEVGGYTVGAFEHGGHTIRVFYRGRETSDRIPPEVNETSYTAFLAEQMLRRLVEEERYA